MLLYDLAWLYEGECIRLAENFSSEIFWLSLIWGSEADQLPILVGWSPAQMLRDCVKFLQIIMQDWLRVKVQEKFRVYNKIMVIKQPNIEVSRFLDYNSVRVQSMVVRISKYFYQIGWWPWSRAVRDGVNKINGFRTFPAWLSLNTNHVNNIFEAIPKGFWVHLSKQRKTYFSDI